MIERNRCSYPEADTVCRKVARRLPLDKHEKQS
jgi:hypothetical protein